MQLRLLALGTLICGTAFGFVAGESIATAPTHRAEDTIDAAPILDDSVYETVQAATPDHYPLITRSGRLEVEDLWKRRPLRMRPYTPADFAPEPQPVEVDAYSPDPKPDAPEESGLVNDTMPTIERGNGLTIESANPDDEVRG